MATLAYDFLQDEDGDLLIENMDFVIGPSDQQHVKDILGSVPGWFKKFPLVGMNPYQYLNGKASQTAINQNATIQLQSDGYVKGPGGIEVKIESGIIDISAVDVFRP
jgi:hypothetical protein